MSFRVIFTFCVPLPDRARLSSQGKEVYSLGRAELATELELGLTVDLISITEVRFTAIRRAVGVAQSEGSLWPHAMATHGLSRHTIENTWIPP